MKIRYRGGRVALAIALICGTALGLASWTSPAFAQSAAVNGVAVGTTSSGAGELVVKGTQQQFLPRGINSVGVLYPGALSYANAAEQSYFQSQCANLPTGAVQALTTAQTVMTTNTDIELLATAEHWQATSVRFHVSQGALEYEHENHGFASGNYQYTDMVRDVIRQSRAMGLVADISMDTEPYSCTTTTGVQRLPTTQTEDAWSTLLQRLGGVGLADDPGIILEPLNEPDSATACGSAQDSWQQWAKGCTGYLGMRDLGVWLRQQAPDQVVLFDADNNGSTFAGFVASQWSMPANSAFAIHPFFYADGTTGWDRRFGNLEVAPSAGGQGQAVFANAWNESANCQDQSLGDFLVQTYLPGHDIGLSMQSWDAPAAVLANQPLGTGNPMAGDPVGSVPNCPFTGAGVIYDNYWSQAGVSVAAPAVHVSPPLTWHSGVVDGATVALADKGSPYGVSPVVPPADVVSSVNVLVQKAGSSSATWVAQMSLSQTGPWWDNGTFTLATVSGLSGKSVTAVARDTLIFRVRYQGVTGYQDTDYLVP